MPSIPFQTYVTPTAELHLVIVGNVGTPADPKYRILDSTLPAHLVPNMVIEIFGSEVRLYNEMPWGGKPSIYSQYHHICGYKEVAWGVSQLVKAYVATNRQPSDPERLNLHVTILSPDVLHPVL
jgi:hypothetical protein